MSKKLLPTIIALTLLLANCSQPGASPTPAPPDTPVQVDLFRLVPPGALGASYTDKKSIREDPDLMSAFGPDYGGAPPSGRQVDAGMAIVWPPPEGTDSSLFVSALTLYRYSSGTAPAPRSGRPLPGATRQDYLGVELYVTETE